MPALRPSHLWWLEEGRGIWILDEQMASEYSPRLEEQRQFCGRGLPMLAAEGVVDMQYNLERLSEEHRKPAIDILNYYVDNGFAAFSESKLPYSLFDIYLQVSAGYPALAR